MLRFQVYEPPCGLATWRSIIWLHAASLPLGYIYGVILSGWPGLNKKQPVPNVPLASIRIQSTNYLPPRVVTEYCKHLLILRQGEPHKQPHGLVTSYPALTMRLCLKRALISFMKSEWYNYRKPLPRGPSSLTNYIPPFWLKMAENGLVWLDKDSRFQLILRQCPAQMTLTHRMLNGDLRIHAHAYSCQARPLVELRLKASELIDRLRRDKLLSYLIEEGREGKTWTVDSRPPLANHELMYKATSARYTTCRGSYMNRAAKLMLACPL